MKKRRWRIGPSLGKCAVGLTTSITLSFLSSLPRLDSFIHLHLSKNKRQRDRRPQYTNILEFTMQLCFPPSYDSPPGLEAWRCDGGVCAVTASCCALCLTEECCWRVCVCVCVWLLDNCPVVEDDFSQVKLNWLLGRFSLIFPQKSCCCLIFKYSSSASDWQGWNNYSFPVANGWCCKISEGILIC